jgi:hypothetical protein
MIKIIKSKIMSNIVVLEKTAFIKILVSLTITVKMDLIAIISIVNFNIQDFLILETIKMIKNSRSYLNMNKDLWKRKKKIKKIKINIKVKVNLMIERRI